MDQVIAHIDMDCFFCSCEIKRDPSLAGKPVIVGSTGNRGVVSAANYEARGFGVFSATPISRARELCPDGVFLPVDFRLYRKESRAIMEIFADLADDMQQVSVDEAYLELTGFSRGFNTLEDMAAHIQQRVTSESGLTCSVGIAESRIVAKIASDYRKPAGITVVRDAKGFLAPLPITKIPGIGKVSSRQYYARGIKTIGDLSRYSRFQILEMFGKHSVQYYDLALGEDRSGIVHRDCVKSVSRERTFPEDNNDRQALKQKLEELCHMVHKDLKGQGFRTVSIKLRNSDFSTMTRDRSLGRTSYSAEDILWSAGSLFEENYMGTDIRLIGVRVSNLSAETSVQKTLLSYL